MVCFFIFIDSLKNILIFSVRVLLCLILDLRISISLLLKSVFPFLALFSNSLDNAIRSLISVSLFNLTIFLFIGLVDQPNPFATPLVNSGNKYPGIIPVKAFFNLSIPGSPLGSVCNHSAILNLVAGN